MSFDQMYTVADIASMFSVNEETVRRWIRGGQLKAAMDSKKGGHKIAAKDLCHFVMTQKPKYQKMLPTVGINALPSLVLPPALGNVATLLMGEMLSKVQKPPSLSKDGVNNDSEILNRLIEELLAESDGEKEEKE